ncbi:glycoside hydrolase family 6 protein [Streptomyces sp. NPDC001941]|uniref:glycoside hydrolase family 6 protein n=1 Tax=Streptomyces sp. NPDC001941 TaxID=3154659 RepID=UPI00332F401F
MNGTRGARTGALALAALLLAGCAADGGAPGAPAAPGPVADGPFWVNPEGSAARQVAEYTRQGRTAEAALIREIADRPVAEWVGSQDPGEQVRDSVEAAAAAGRQPVFVLYDIPHRDCGQHSAGGAEDADAYREWVDEVAGAVGERSATVVLEPDAVMHMVDRCTDAAYHEERYALLRGAVERLKRQPGTTVYLDAGNAGWARPEELREPLRRAGVAAADGFAVNVSNFQTTRASTEYGRKVSALVGGKPFVVDTSRNGNGPYTGGDPAENWCNPPGRALGEPPTTATGDPLVKAYLWIKRPGESDGPCKGGPPAGAWFEEYALDLVRNARARRP